MKMYTNQILSTWAILFLIFPTVFLGTVANADNDTYYIKINDYSFSTGIIGFSEIVSKVQEAGVKSQVGKNLLEIEISNEQEKKLNEDAIREVIEGIDNCRFMRRDSPNTLKINGVELSHLIYTLHFFRLNPLAKNLMETGGFTLEDMIRADHKGLTIRFLEPCGWKLKEMYPKISYRKLKVWGYSIKSFAKTIHCDADFWNSYPKLEDIAIGGWSVAEVVDSKAYELQEIIDIFKNKTVFQKKDIKLIVDNYEEKVVKNILGLTDIQYELMQYLKEDASDSHNADEAQDYENDLDNESTDHLLPEPGSTKSYRSAYSYQPSARKEVSCTIL